MATGRRRGRVIIYIALILILLLVLLFVLTQGNPFNRGAAVTNNPAAQATTPQPAPTQVSDVVNIVVNTQDVARGKPLTDDLLALVAIPRADYTQGVFYTDKKEVVNSRARYDLKAHTPLTSALIVTTNATGSIPSFEIPAGKVAVSIHVDKMTSVAYGLQKGDHVNVIASLLLVDLDTNFQSKLPNNTGVVIAPGPIGVSQAAGQTTTQTQTSVTASLTVPTGSSVMGRVELDPTLNNPVWVIPSEGQRPRMVSQTLIQDAVILQMGTFGKQTTPAQPVATQQSPQPTQQAQATQQAPTELPYPDVATLIVSPQDAVTLNYLMLSGANLNLVMRSAGDTEAKTTEAVTLQFIMDQYNIPNPAKLPFGMEPNTNNIDNQPLESTSSQPVATPQP